VNRTRVNKARESQLPDVAQPLEPGMPHQIINKIIRYTDKSVYRVIDNLFPVSQTALVLCWQIYSIVSKNGKEKLHIQHSTHFFR